MKGFNRFSVLTLIISMAVLFSGMVAEAHMNHDRHGGFMMRHLLKGLDLTDHQKVQIRGIMQAGGKELREARLAVLQARKDLMEATAAGRPDAAAVKEASAALSTAEERIALLRAGIFAQVFPVLTPEQQQVERDRIAKVSRRMDKAIERLRAKSNPEPQEETP